MANTSIELSKRPAEIEDFLRIRYWRYVKEMGAEPENDSGLEQDHHDLNGNCHYIIIKKDDEVIGGCRLIDRRMTQLPIENFISMDNLKNLPENSAEISRYTLSRNCQLSRLDKINLQRELNEFIACLGDELGINSFVANIRYSCLLWQNKKIGSVVMTKIGNPNFHDGAGKLVPIILVKKTEPL